MQPNNVAEELAELVRPGVQTNAPPQEPTRIAPGPDDLPPESRYDADTCEELDGFTAGKAYGDETFAIGESHQVVS